MSRKRMVIQHIVGVQARYGITVTNAKVVDGMEFSIRRPDLSDTESVVSISAMCCPDYAEKPGAWAAAAARPTPERSYWVAEARSGGASSRSRVVGYGRFEPERQGVSASPTYRVYVGVHPDFRHVGIGGSLLDRMTHELAALGAERICTRTRADQLETIRFLVNHGFREYERKIHLMLDLGALDPALLIEACGRSRERMAAAGISILDLVEYSRNQPDWLPKLLSVYNTLGADVPDADPYQPIDRDAFEGVLADPDLPHAGFFVTTTGERLIGYSYLLVPQGKKEAIVAMTGVLPEHRRQGVATALKLHGMCVARSEGISRMVTSASAANTASIAVNERLGFRQTHAEARLEKLIQE